MPFELTRVKLSSLLQDIILGRLWHAEFLGEMSERSMERQVEGKLDKANEVTAASATVAVEDVFDRVDEKRGVSLAVQRTESDEFMLGTDWAANPMTPPQVVQQWQMLFELLQILAHQMVFAPGLKSRRDPP